MTHKFEALLYAVLFTFWSVRLYYKLYDKKIRKYILSIGLLIIFWMLIRMGKGVVETHLLKRMAWYLYYVPLIFIPAIYYICSNSLLKSIGKKRKIIIYLISTILFLLVITNDYHEFVFKFNAGVEDFDNYKHNIGYYMISVWIFYLLGGGMIRLSINSWHKSKNIKAFLPLFILLLGVCYTVLYVIDIWNIREINMSIVNSVLICLGIEIAFYLDLIPNNKKYLKTFENSNLDMAIISLDGKTKYTTKRFESVPKRIMNDINCGVVKNMYREGYIVNDVKRNSDSYVIIRNDYRELSKLRREVAKKQGELLKQQVSIRIEEKVKRELYEVNLRKKVVSRIEESLNEKRMEAESILLNGNISNEDLERIKRIIIYSKKKSSIMISELNNEVYNEEGIRLVLNELITSMDTLRVSGLVIVKDKLMIRAGMLSILYDIVYEIISNINNKTLMVYLYRENNFLKLKISINGSISIPDKLKNIKNVKFKENSYDNDTEMVFSIKEWDNL